MAFRRAHSQQLTHEYALQAIRHNYCALCLSTNRQFVKRAFLTANAIMYKFPKFISVSPMDQICWECFATLTKVIGFHHRSAKAKAISAKAAVLNNTTLESLSSLKRTAISIIDIAPITDETSKEDSSVHISINESQGDRKKPIIVRSKENGTNIDKFIIENATYSGVMKEDDDKNSYQSQAVIKKANIGCYVESVPNARNFPKIPVCINNSTQTNLFKELNLDNHEKLPIRIVKVMPISENVYQNLGATMQVQNTNELALSSGSVEFKVENELEICDVSPDASDDPLIEARPITCSYPELSMDFDEYDDEIERNYRPGDRLQMKICLKLCYKKLEFLAGDTAVANKVENPLRRREISKYLEKHYTSTYANIKSFTEIVHRVSACSVPKNIATVYLKEITKPPEAQSMSADHNYYRNENKDYQNTNKDSGDIKNAIPTSTVISSIPIMELHCVDLDKFEAKNKPDLGAANVIPIQDLMHVKVNRFGIPTNMNFPHKRQVRRKKKKQLLSKLSPQTIRIYNDVLPSEISDKEMLKIREIDRKNPSYVKAKFKCEKCIFGYDVENNYKAHMHRHVDDYGPELCNVCELRFKTFEQLEEHKKMHSIAFYCTHCRFGSRFVKSVAAHNKLVHKKPAPFQCKQCDSSYSKDSELQRHTRSAHTPAPTCDHCSRQFRLEYTLKIHMKSHEPRAMKPCPVCGMSFTGKNLSTHMKRAHEPSSWPKDADNSKFFCADCQKFFATQALLDYHMKGPKHSTTMDFECDYCHRRFHRKSYLSTHIKLMHLPRIMYPCSVCRKSFKRRNITREHENKVHFGTWKKTHVCHVCGKAFHSSSLLKCHRVIHSGQKPFQCQFCPSKFAQKSTLYNHCKFKHEDVIGTRTFNWRQVKFN